MMGETAHASPERDAIVVGSGPNGLAAAVVLAQAGCRVRVFEGQGEYGGGTRSAELTLPGFVHDVCSTSHPLGAGSPLFRSLDLARYGLEWIDPPVALAHPFDDGSAAAVWRSLDRTVQALGEDGPAYRRMMEPLVTRWDDLAVELLQPMLHLPRHPLLMARFGVRAVQSGAGLARRSFRGAHARALLSGMAAHSFLPLEAPISASFALVLGAAAHAVGWPLARGGSQRIADALAACLRAHGGEILEGHPVDDVRALPAARAVLLDLSAWEASRVARSVLPGWYADRLERFEHAPGVFKVDYALDRPIPWSAELCRDAGVVHLGGTMEEIAEAERDVNRGKTPARPFVLLAQQSLFDSSRAPQGRHTAWAYCHVPLGSHADMSEAIDAQIERFAPGFASTVLARHTSAAIEMAAYNTNLAGGDISGGASTLRQMLARPVLSPVPYRMPARGLYLCSSSTPPGGGVHGMCGYHAAKAALSRELRV
jgi:phytoene dehydrogenase-like protein